MALRARIEHPWYCSPALQFKEGASPQDQVRGDEGSSTGLEDAPKRLVAKFLWPTHQQELVQTSDMGYSPCLVDRQGLHQISGVRVYFAWKCLTAYSNKMRTVTRRLSRPCLFGRESSGASNRSAWLYWTEPSSSISRWWWYLPKLRCAKA